METDELILTKGEKLVDRMMGALIAEWKHPTVRSIKQRVRSATEALVRYIEELDGVPAPHMLERLKTTNRHAWAMLKDSRRLRKAADARNALESHISDLEIAAGKRTRLPAQGGRPKTKGWCVDQDRGGTWWRIQLTSMSDGRPRQLPERFKTKREATVFAKATIAELRSNAA